MLFISRWCLVYQIHLKGKPGSYFACETLVDVANKWRWFVPAFRVHAYSPHCHNRVATVEVKARDIPGARDKARAELYKQGRQPNFLTLVPVEVITSSSVVPV